MTITTQHPASSYGMPVILDDDGQVMDYPSGIRAWRQKLGHSTQDLANLCNVSRRTVEGWEQGRTPNAAALNVMRDLLAKSG